MQAPPIRAGEGWLTRADLTVDGHAGRPGSEGTAPILQVRGCTRGVRRVPRSSPQKFLTELLPTIQRQDHALRIGADVQPRWDVILRHDGIRPDHTIIHLGG